MNGIYSKWSAQEVELLKHELWKQRKVRHLDWIQIAAVFPGRTKQQLVSYRNSHKNELYSSIQKQNQDSINSQYSCSKSSSEVDPNYYQTWSSLRKTKHSLRCNETIHELSKISHSKIAFEPPPKICNPEECQIDPNAFVRNNFLIATIAGLSEFTDEEFRQRVINFTGDQNQDDVFQIRLTLKNNLLAKELIMSGGDPFMFYTNHDLLVNHLRSFMIVLMVRSFLLNSEFTPHNAYQKKFHDALLLYLNTNTINAFQVRYYLSGKHMIEEIYEILVEKCMTNESVKNIVQPICEGLDLLLQA